MERKIIYLDDAIDAARKCAVKEVTPAYMLIDKAEVMTELMKLPSAQPEIIRCKDCKQFRRWIDTNICFCDITESERLDNDFCSRAERRIDEGD